MSLIALYSLTRSLLSAKAGEKFFKGTVLNVVTVAAALIVYILILSRFGYLLSTFMLLICLFKAAGFRKWSLILAAAFLAAAFSYVLFGHWLNVRLPKGFWGF